MSETTPLLVWQKLLRLLRLGGEAGLRESLTDVLDEAPDDGAFSDKERAMLRNILGFSALRVEDVMVPRADVQAIEVGSSWQELVARFSTTGHSRLPVFRETLDQPLGMLHVKHVLGAYYASLAENQHEINMEQLLRGVLFVPPSMPCLDLLLKMQASRNHLALVIDEYGGTDGLVTIEDLIEEIVGEIADELDDEPLLLLQQTPFLWRASSRASLASLEEALNLPFTSILEDADIDTLGGLVATIAGRVPERGEMIPYQFKAVQFKAAQFDKAALDNGQSDEGQENGEDFVAPRVEFVIRDGDARRIKTIDVKLVAD